MPDTEKQFETDIEKYLTNFVNKGNPSVLNVRDFINVFEFSKAVLILSFSIA